MDSRKDIRESVAAGSFYPQDPDVLKKQINKFLDNAESQNLKNIKALVCPHAGYVYSGQIAAHSYKQIIGRKFDCVIIIAPSHAEYFDFISIYSGKAYRTPLGLVDVDSERSKVLASQSSNIKLSPCGHRDEHSLEVQIPFLQLALRDFKIIPIVMGQQNKKNIDELGEAIGNLFKNDSILIIASTDLSHYYPYEVAVSLDKKVEKLIKTFDIENLEDGFVSGKIEMCGGGPVTSAMIASKILGAGSAKVLCCQNSGDVTGDRSAVVGYLSAVFYSTSI